MSKTFYPLTYSQFCLIAPQIFTYRPLKTRSYNVISWKFSIKGETNEAGLRYAFNRLLENNDSLRIRFKHHWYTLKQYVEEYRYCDVETIALESVEDLDKKCYEYRKRYIKVLNNDLFYAVIFTYPQGATLFMCMHHYIFDGYSIGLASKQLESYYEDYKNGDLEHEYKHFSIEEFLEDEAANKHSLAHKRDLEYWSEIQRDRRHFTMVAPPRSRNVDAEQYNVELSEKQTQDILKYCKNNQVSLSSFVMTSAAIMVNRTEGKTNFDFAQLSHGRGKFKYKQMIGCLVSIFPVYYNLIDKTDVDSYYKTKYTDYLETFKHSRVSPLSTVIRALGICFKAKQLNLYGVMFSEVGVDNRADSIYRTIVFPQQCMPNQMYVLYSVNQAGKLEIMINYQKALYSSEQIETIINNTMLVINETIYKEARC